MEFGSLGLGLQSQSASNQTGVSSLAPTATLQSNPENTVTPIESGGASQNDRRQDLLGDQDQLSVRSGARNAVTAPDSLQLTSRRTTLNFDSEQNRIFLEVVDTTTDEVIEQIPSEQLVEFVDQALHGKGGTGRDEPDSAPLPAEIAV